MVPLLILSLGFFLFLPLWLDFSSWSISFPMAGCVTLVDFPSIVYVMEALRGDYVGSSMDEESSSSTSGVSGEVLLSSHANEVITWIRPVKESRADALWKRFSFPSYVRPGFHP